jgi:hypothetical protein
MSKKEMGSDCNNLEICSLNTIGNVIPDTTETKDTNLSMLSLVFPKYLLF